MDLETYIRTGSIDMDMDTYLRSGQYKGELEFEIRNMTSIMTRMADNSNEIQDDINRIVSIRGATMVHIIKDKMLEKDMIWTKLMEMNEILDETYNLLHDFNEAEEYVQKMTFYVLYMSFGEDTKQDMIKMRNKYKFDYVESETIRSARLAELSSLWAMRTERQNHNRYRMMRNSDVDYIKKDYELTAYFYNFLKEN
jgi:hypothetical protein